MKKISFWFWAMVVLAAMLLSGWSASLWIAGCTSALEESIVTTTTTTASAVTTSTSAVTTTTKKTTTTTVTTTTTTTTTAPAGAWTEVTTSASFSPREGHTSLFFNGKLWVIAGGADGIPYKNDVWYSQDGANWFQSIAGAGFVGRKHHASVVFDGKMWVIGGYTYSAGNYNNQNDVWYSTDGINWTLATAEAGFSGRSGHAVVVFNNKMWVIGGATFESGFFSSRLKDVWSSTNGIEWTREDDGLNPFSTRAAHSCVVFDNKMWVIGGFNGISSLNDVWYSSDGINWGLANISAAFSGRGGHTSVVYDNKMWVIGGDAGGVDPYRNDVWSSADGAVWTEEAYSGFPGRRYLTSVASDEIWIIGGFSPVGYFNDVWRYP